MCRNGQKSLEPTYIKTIFFDLRLDNISSAIFKLFGAVRYIDLPYSSPSISSTPSKASTAKQPCIISSKNDRNARSWKLQEMLTEPPFVVTSKDEKTSVKSETKSIIVDCNDEVWSWMIWITL